MKAGTFPLYVPGFAGGHSSIALTLGQFLHPLPYISSFMPGYWMGKAIEWNTLIKLLSLAVTQLILFLFLRKLRVGMVFSFLFSFITVYNLRMLDLFRHGAPLEGYTAFLVLYAVIGWYFIRSTRWVGPLSIIAVTYLLVCSGHPEEMYYGMLGAGLFTLTAPFFLPLMLPDTRMDFSRILRYWGKTGSFLVLGCILSAVYILPFYFDFIAVNADRVTQTYAMANSNLDSFIGTLGNFFFPLRSQVNGAFGGALLIIIPLSIPVLKLFKKDVPRSVWFIWGICFVVFLHIQGSRTPVHRLVWHYLPFASSIRDAGRISIMLPFFMMLLASWTVNASFMENGAKRPRPVAILAGTSAVLLFAFYLIHVAGTFLVSSPGLTLFSTYFFENMASISLFQLELVIALMGMASLLILVFHDTGGKRRRLVGICLTAIIILQTGIVLKYRSINWIEDKSDAPTFQEMLEQKKTSLDYRYYPGFGMSSSTVKEQLERSFMEPFLGRIFTQLIHVDSRESAYDRMEAGRRPRQAFVEGIDPQTVMKVNHDAQRMSSGTVDLVYSSCNKLIFHVQSDAPALFGLSYPYTTNWKARVNGEVASVYRMNGASHGVLIPGGDTMVEFRYWSEAFFRGMVISCVTFALIGLFVCYFGLNGCRRIAGMILVCVIAAGVYGLWHRSLYSGVNLETRYRWTYSPPVEAVNIAYGKNNWLDPFTMSTSRGGRELDLYKSRFVDGQRGHASGFTTKLSDNPAWILDLSRGEQIGKIVLYEPGRHISVDVGPLTVLERFNEYDYPYRKDPRVNVRPLTIELSDDGRTWITAASVVSSIKENTPVIIDFDGVRSARYLRIKAAGMSQLAFDEVEVYGP